MDQLIQAINSSPHCCQNPSISAAPHRLILYPLVVDGEADVGTASVIGETFWNMQMKQGEKERSKWKMKMDHIRNYLFLLFPFFVLCQGCSHALEALSNVHAGLHIIRPCADDWTESDTVMTAGAGGVKTKAQAVMGVKSIISLCWDAYFWGELIRLED